MLLKEDHELHLACNVAEAQEILAVQPVDLVITDLRMPRQSGVELLKWIKECQPDIEVIILTGFGELETAMKAVSYKAFAYLEKPFDNDELLDHVQRALHQRHQDRERRRLQELALDANRFESVGRFVSGILHDLGTPLSVIGSQVDLIAPEEGLGGLERRLNLIRSQSEHCNTLVRKAMGFLRHQTNAFSTIGLNDVVESCMDVARPVLVRQGIRVVKDLAPDIPACFGDLVLLRQALLNLIVNACQAMESQDTAREIHVRTWEEGGQICLTICDTGPGIALHMRSQIFEAFFSTKGDKGTGIGLAAVNDIMNKHNGKVSLEESKGHGACFKLVFPAYSNVERHQKEPAQSADPAPPPSKSEERLYRASNST
jgi:signal transduction histidine kinase